MQRFVIVSSLLVSVIALFVNVGVAYPAIIGEPVVNPTNLNTYVLLERSTWTAAEAEAVSLGGHLVTIESEEENVWVRDTFSTFNGGTYSLLWIGLSDAESEGTFVWSSGAPLTYTNWRAGEPNGAYSSEDYVHITANYGNGEWVDRRNSDGNALYGVVELETGSVANQTETLGAVKARYQD